MGKAAKTQEKEELFTLALLTCLPLPFSAGLGLGKANAESVVT